jgi:tetratricopeptide (TPR) repeat protein
MVKESLTPDQAMAAAKQLVKQGNPAAAITLYQQILAKAPQHKKAKKELRALQRSVSGTGSQPSLQDEMARLMQFYNAGRLDQALTQAKRLCHLYPDQPVPYNIAGVILATRGENEAAITGYQQALSIEPGYIDVSNNLGSALHSLGRYEEALACYKNTIHLNPSDADAYYNMGNSLKALERLTEAATSYQKSINIRPLYAPAHVGLGNALKEQNKPNQAVASYRNAIDIDPKLIDAYVNIGSVLHMKRLYVPAIAWYKDAIKLHPGHLRAQLGLALNLMETGKREEALATCQKCLEQDPDSREARHLLNIAENMPEDGTPEKE